MPRSVRTWHPGVGPGGILQSRGLLRKRLRCCTSDTEVCGCMTASPSQKLCNDFVGVERVKDDSACAASGALFFFWPAFL